MDTEILTRHFERMGAAAEIVKATAPDSVSLDIRVRDGREVFQIRAGAEADLRVVDLQPRDRHLLLMSRDADGRKDKFLCGHDERHWFVAAVPNAGGVSNVLTAKEALKPPAVRAEQEHKGVSNRKRQRRRNAAFVRQGEWFFVPSPRFTPDADLIWRNEPISRGRGKPYICEEFCRTGGETVYTAAGHPNPLTAGEWRKKLQQRPHLANLSWQARVRNARVFVRGRVRHPDHATIRLDGWHEVLMNTENQAPSMRHVAFID